MIGKICSALWEAWLWFWDRLDPAGAVIVEDPDHRRGPRLLRLLRMSVARARREVLRLGSRWERAISVAGDGPGLRLWEALHILLLGATGSGKTQILRALVTQIITGREGQVLIIDRKGDFTAWLAGRDDVAILAPWDRRTRSWAVGIDIADALGAAALAERLLPLDTQTNDRYWVDTPRNMIRAAIRILQALHARREGLDGGGVGPTSPGPWDRNARDWRLGSRKLRKAPEPHRPSSEMN